MDFPLAATIAEAQNQQREWSLHNFPSNTQLYIPALGIAEEAGELCHAVLKKIQNIRGDSSKHYEEIYDAIGDLSIYQLDLCNKMSINYTRVVLNTWNKVSKRDWIKFPNDGLTE